ncbi:MAG: hypothetical protein ACYDGX_08380, partial [Thermoleophilia bacterium]
VLYISMNSIIVLGPFTAYLLFGLQTENISRVGRNLSDLYDQKYLFNFNMQTDYADLKCRRKLEPSNLEAGHASGE